MPTEKESRTFIDLTIFFLASQSRHYSVGTTRDAKQIKWNCRRKQIKTLNTNDPRGRNID